VGGVPSLDDSKIALFAARKIIIECWGHYYRKMSGKCTISIIRKDLAKNR